MTYLLGHGFCLSLPWMVNKFDAEKVKVGSKAYRESCEECVRICIPNEHWKELCFVFSSPLHIYT